MRDGELDLPSLGTARRSGHCLAGRWPDGHGRDGRARRPDRGRARRRPAGRLRGRGRAAADRRRLLGAALASTLELIGQARELGACAAMVAAPPLLRNVDQLPAYMQGAAAGGLPLIIQDEPNATGVLLPVSILLAAAVASGSRTMKIEDPPTPPKIGRLLAADPGARPLRRPRRRLGARRASAGRLRHDDRLRLPGDPARRPRAGRGGRLAQPPALLFDRYLPLIQFEAQQVVGLAIRKEVLRRRGRLHHPSHPRPGADPRPADARGARRPVRPARDRARTGAVRAGLTAASAGAAE